MRNATGIRMLGILSILLLGCSKSDMPRGAITGNVTVGGQPLQSGRILFLPCDGNKGPTVTIPVVNGMYVAAKQEGPLVGPQRVEVEADVNLGFPLDDEESFARRGGLPLPQQWIPPQFNRDSQLKTDIAAKKANVFDIAIPAGNASY